MEQVLDVYKESYDEGCPVVCMDESPKQLIRETRIPIKMKKGCERKEDYEYERCGVANIFMANEPLAGKRYVKVTERKKKTDWAVFVKEIADEHYPEATKIRLVMDNYCTHRAAALYEAFRPEEAKRIWDRFEFIYTPKHGSWLNMAEIELHVLMGQCLNRRIDKMEEYRFGWHHSDYRGLRPFNDGVLVFRDQDNDNALTERDIQMGLDPTPNRTINIQWSGIGKTNFSAGAQVISGQSYINPAGESIDCSAFAAYGNGQLGDGKFNKGAYDVFINLLWTLNLNNYIFYTLLDESYFDEEIKREIQNTYERMNPKLN